MAVDEEVPVIPTVLALGLLAGVLLPARWRWWSVVVLGVGWGVLVASQPQPEVGRLLVGLGAVGLGAVNALVAVVVGWGIGAMGSRLRQAVARRF